jgi:NAD-dependent dihydropyrimidine dehydrogenase PreA subunit
LPAKITVDEKLCDGCGDCVTNCPTQTLAIQDGKCVGVRPDDCMVCQYCETVCPKGAIKVQDSSVSGLD